MDRDLFVENVKNICNLRGIAPTVACRESGAGRNFINHIEVRGSIPSVEKVSLLAAYLGVTTSELLGEVDPRLGASFPELSSDAWQVALAFDKADGKAKEIVRVALDL